MQPMSSQVAGTVDWARIEAWRQDLEAGELDRIRAAFGPVGLGGLEVVRSPPPAALRAQANRFLLEDWLAQRKGAMMPMIGAIDPIRWLPALGAILLVEPIDRGRDFRYRLYGSDVVAVSGYEMTGKPMTAHAVPAELICFGIALYRTVLQRPEAVMTVNRPTLAAFSCWERIVLPFADATGAVVRFAVGNVGFGQDGRELHG
jgi:hypothetical protein